MNFYMELDFEDGVEIIKEALEQRRKQEHWDIYLSKYPNMTEKTFIPFDKFYKRHDVATMSTESVVNKKVDNKEYAINAISLAEQIKQAHMKQKGDKDLHVEKGKTSF